MSPIGTSGFFLIYFKSIFEIYSKFGRIFDLSLCLMLRLFKLEWMFSVEFCPSFFIIRWRYDYKRGSDYKSDKTIVKKVLPANAFPCEWLLLCRRRRLLWLNFGLEPILLWNVWSRFYGLLWSHFPLFFYAPLSCCSVGEL